MKLFRQFRCEVTMNKIKNITLGNGKVAQDSKDTVEGKSIRMETYWMRKLYMGQKGPQRL